VAEPFDPRHAARLDDPARLDYQPVADVLGLLELRGDETVVDYGAGVGYTTVPLAAALPRGRVVAVDRSAELLDELRRRVTASAAGRAPAVTAPVELMHTTANRVPLPDAGADAILTVSVWHEIYDDQSALDELRRLLAPGGALAIVDWAPVERPVGPPAARILTLEQALAVVASMGLTAAVVRPAGTLFAYYYAIVARRTARLMPSGTLPRKVA
jgi:ubiquinone/menaquinone biosynthesis C-methylase UbiE